MKNPKISVIIPVYNTKVYLRRCVDSVLAQSYRDLEIILVDDGSSDGSGEICDKYNGMDSRIRVIHKENAGQLSARVAGANAASGEYITNVDSDDWIEFDRIKKIVDEGLQEEPDMVYLDEGTRRFDTEYCENDILTRFFEHLIGDKVLFFDKADLAHWNVFVKREIYKSNINRIDERIRRMEDVVTLFACILDCRQINCVIDEGYHYEKRDGSISRSAHNWDKNHPYWYYEQIQYILSRHEMRATNTVRKAATLFIYQNAFLTNYKSLYDFYQGYLFPFFEAVDGSKLIVYGAGNFGVEIVNAIKTNDRFSIEAWVDKTPSKNARSMFQVSKIETIKEREFDYIVIAIMKPSISDSVKKQLIHMGVDENKVLVMKNSYMRMEDLNDIFAPSIDSNI